MAATHHSLQVPTRWELFPSQGRPRSELESYVKGCFAAMWGAEVTEFLPWLAGMRNDDGGLVGVLGMRPAESAPLFLEQYLDRPVEEDLSVATGERVGRESIVEIGNLASATPGGARWLITALTAYLHAAGREWVVFTGGPELRNAFSRLGLPLHELAPADPVRIGPAAARWGRYYDQGPSVMAGRVEDGFRKLSALFTAECALRSLWDAAGHTSPFGA